MQRPFTRVLHDLVEKIREVERVVPPEARIRVGAASTLGFLLFFFYSFFLVLTAEFAFVMYENEGVDCSDEGGAT